MRRRSLVTQVTAAAVAVAVVVAVAFVVALAAISSLRRSNARETQSKDVVAATLEAQTLVVDLETGIRGYVISKNAQFLSPWQDATKQWPQTVARLESLVAGDAEEGRRVHELATLVTAYNRDYALPVIRIVQVAPSAALTPVASAEGKTRIDAMRGELDRILTVEAGRSQARAKTARAVAHRATVAGMVGLGASALLVLLFGAWVTRAVADPVRRVSESAATVAAGDLSTRLEEGGSGEIGLLTRAFNAMTRALEGSRDELVAQNERLRASEEATSDLVAMISHELRTPLSSVLGFTKLLLEREFDPQERHRYLEIIDTEARRLAQLADDFLDVRSLEEGRVELSFAPVDLAELVRNQTDLFFAHERRHHVTMDLPEGDLVVSADRDRVSQIVANLLSNAIKYSPEGGHVEVSLHRENSHVRLSVADEGVGIAPDDQPRIFEKFYRGGAPAAGIPGTGLGLAVARTIVDGHGGRIGFDSEAGVGSVFWVELPVEASKAA